MDDQQPTPIPIRPDFVDEEGGIPDDFVITCTEAGSIYQEALNLNAQVVRLVNLNLHEHAEQHAAECPYSRMTPAEIHLQGQRAVEHMREEYAVTDSVEE